MLSLVRIGISKSVTYDVDITTLGLRMWQNTIVVGFLLLLLQFDFTSASGVPVQCESFSASYLAVALG